MNNGGSDYSVGGLSPVGAVGDDAQVSWTAEDELWVASIPPHFASIARRHGRELFCYVMQGNEVGVALTKLRQRLNGNRELMFCLDVLTGTFNDLSTHRFQNSGWTKAQVQEVHQDAARAAQLANIGPEQRSNGGIIIAH